MTTKIVITGATGFIGTALCKKLENIEEYLIVKVTRSQDKTGFYKMDNHKTVPSGDVLIHLGEDSDRARVNKIGERYIDETGKVIDTLLENKYKKIIYCSSSIVYGDKGNEPYTENCQTYSDDIYSAAKLRNEKRVLNAGGVVVRLSNVIGEGMSINNVFSDILKQLHDLSPLVIRNVNPIRDFVWIDDVVDALMLLIIKSTPGVFNVGTGEPISIYDLALLFLKLAKQENRKITSIVKESSYSYNVISNKKIKKILNWKPNNTIYNSAKNMVDSL